MSIFDLQHLELSYTTQYCSAKDTVNIAGSVGSNILSGDVEVVHPEERQGQPKYSQVVDVRPAVEFEHGHISSAVNLPLASLGDSMPALMDPGRLRFRVGWATVRLETGVTTYSLFIVSRTVMPRPAHQASFVCIMVCAVCVDDQGPIVRRSAIINSPTPASLFAL